MTVPIQSAPPVEVSGVDSMSITLTGVTAGNCLIIEVSYVDLAASSAGVPNTPTDTNGTPQAAANPSSQFTSSGHAAGAAIFYVPNCAAGTHAITFNPFGNTGFHQVYGSIAMQEWPAATAPLDGAFGSNGSDTGGGSSGGTTGSTGTLSSASDFLITALNINSSSGLSNAGISSPPSGFTASLWVEQDTGANEGAESSYKSTAGSTAAQSATYTWTADGSIYSWQAVIAAFKAPAGGADTFLGQACL